MLGKSYCEKNQLLSFGFDIYQFKIVASINLIINKKKKHIKAINKLGKTAV